MMEYRYLGDRLTRPDLVGRECRAVRRADGRCRRSRLGTMLVSFDNGETHVVLARRLRKITC